MDKCMACGGGPVTREVRSETFEYRGHSLKYDQEADWCAQCDEGFLDKKTKSATDPLLDAFIAKIERETTQRGE